jgi:hypothetical protein
VTARRAAQPAGKPADLPPERAYPLLKQQLAKLQELKGHNYAEVEATEEEWRQFTETLVLRAFGSESTNYRNFTWAENAGEHYMVPYDEGIPHQLNQSNYEARMAAYETALRSCISSLELDLPDAGIKGVYEPGQEYEFYADVKGCLKSAQQEILIVEPYPSTELFDVYAQAIPRTVRFRLLTAPNIPADVKTLAQKYAAGGNFALRTTNAIHDRVLFADKHVWVTGQSIKDAAKKKPTYIIELDEPLMRSIYESVWQAATVIV